jgi:hypothetical protein
MNPIIDWQFLLSIYSIIGLITLLMLIKVAKAIDDYDELSENLGKLVVYSVFGWPYILVVWVFSWAVWLKKL